MSSFVFFGDDIDVGLSVDEAIKDDIVVVKFDPALEVTFTAGVAPGIDETVAPVDAVVGDEGASGFSSKFSAYNTLAGLLRRINQSN